MVSKNFLSNTAEQTSTTYIDLFLFLLSNWKMSYINICITFKVLKGKTM